MPEDPSRDLFSDDDAIAELILMESDRAWDPEVCVQLTRVFNFVREHSATPDYASICAITGCSRKRGLKQ